MLQPHQIRSQPSIIPISDPRIILLLPNHIHHFQIAALHLKIIPTKPQNFPQLISKIKAAPRHEPGDSSNFFFPNPINLSKTIQTVQVNNSISSHFDFIPNKLINSILRTRIIFKVFPKFPKLVNQFQIIEKRLKNIILADSSLRKDCARFTKFIRFRE